MENIHEGPARRQAVIIGSKRNSVIFLCISTVACG